MEKLEKAAYQWNQLRIGITGANGSLGIALTKELRNRGSYVIGITSNKQNQPIKSPESPNEFINWKCGKEDSLDSLLLTLDILILNHGINNQGTLKEEIITKALEVNSLSHWRLMNRFEEISSRMQKKLNPREVWVNTSEAEMQPALSPVYEISKRLIGQLVSIKWSRKNKDKDPNFKIKKLILGPFRSKLNPIGIMSADLVARQILYQADLKLNLIIVTPNPLTYLIMPLVELFRIGYYKLTSNLNKKTT